MSALGGGRGCFVGDEVAWWEVRVLGSGVKVLGGGECR